MLFWQLDIIDTACCVDHNGAYSEIMASVQASVSESSEKRAGGKSMTGVDRDYKTHQNFGV